MMRRSTSESTTATAAERLDEADSPVEGLDAGTLSIHTHLRRKTGKPGDESTAICCMPNNHLSLSR